MERHSEEISRFLAALAELEEAVQENMARSNQIRDRVRWLRSGIAQGHALTPLVRSEPQPLIVEMITTNIENLQTIGAGLRYAEARALRQEGLTMEAIAQLFGVTRQRVSALLKRPAAPIADSERAPST